MSAASGALAFEFQLLRLKQQLGVREDQEVAELLGLTKAALSIRKARGAFPIAPLIDLAKRRPEIDIHYVLTGAEPHRQVDPDSIGERLRNERRRLGMNQDALAEIGGVKRRAQINYEAGARDPSARYLAAVARVGVDVLYVVTGSRAVAA